MTERVCVGRVVGARGIKGEVRIQPFTARPEDVAAYGRVSDESGRRTFEARVVATDKGQAVARLSGVADRTEAERLKGMLLYVPRAALPAPEAGEYYRADLIGLAAIAPDGAPLGRIAAIHDYGAGVSLEIARESGAPVLVPFTDACVPAIDIASGQATVALPEGLVEQAVGEARPAPRRRSPRAKARRRA